jgi:hypothetical protein
VQAVNGVEQHSPLNTLKMKFSAAAHKHTRQGSISIEDMSACCDGLQCTHANMQANCVLLYGARPAKCGSHSAGEQAPVQLATDMLEKHVCSIMALC